MLLAGAGITDIYITSFTARLSSGSTLFDIQSFNFTYKLLFKRYFVKKEKQTTNVVWSLCVCVCVCVCERERERERERDERSKRTWRIDGRTNGCLDGFADIEIIENGLFATNLCSGGPSNYHKPPQTTLITPNTFCIHKMYSWTLLHLYYWFTSNLRHLKLIRRGLRGCIGQSFVKVLSLYQPSWRYLAPFYCHYSSMLKV